MTATAQTVHQTVEKTPRGVSFQETYPGGWQVEEAYDIVGPSYTITDADRNRQAAIIRFEGTYFTSWNTLMSPFRTVGAMQRVLRLDGRTPNNIDYWPMIDLQVADLDPFMDLSRAATHDTSLEYHLGFGVRSKNSKKPTAEKIADYLLYVTRNELGETFAGVQHKNLEGVSMIAGLLPITAPESLHSAGKLIINLAASTIRSTEQTKGYQIRASQGYATAVRE